MCAGTSGSSVPVIEIAISPLIYGGSSTVWIRSKSVNPLFIPITIIPVSIVARGDEGAGLHFIGSNSKRVRISPIGSFEARGNVRIGRIKDDILRDNSVIIGSVAEAEVFSHPTVAVGLFGNSVYIIVAAILESDRTETGHIGAVSNSKILHIGCDLGIAFVEIVFDAGVDDVSFGGVAGGGDSSDDCVPAGGEGGGGASDVDEGAGAVVVFNSIRIAAGLVANGDGDRRNGRKSESGGSGDGEGLTTG